MKEGDGHIYYSRERRRRPATALAVCARALTLSSVLCASLILAAPLATPAAAAKAPKVPAGGDAFLSSIASVARNLRLSKVPGTIDVSADRLEFDYAGGRLEYSGDVLVEHAGVMIRADHITVSFAAGGSLALQKIEARGSVRVLRGDESAYGDRALYDPSKATIVLSHNARLGSGPNLLTGERVVVYLDEGRAVVESEASVAKEEGGKAAPPGDSAAKGSGDSRVRVIIMPDSFKSGGGFGGAPRETPAAAGVAPAAPTRTDEPSPAPATGDDEAPSTPAQPAASEEPAPRREEAQPGETRAAQTVADEPATQPQAGAPPDAAGNEGGVEPDPAQARQPDAAPAEAPARGGNGKAEPESVQ